MAGLQSLLRSTPFLRNPQVIFSNILVKQSLRANHVFSSGFLRLSNRIYVKKLKILCSTHLQYSYRLASTSSELDEILKSSKEKSSTDALQDEAPLNVAPTKTQPPEATFTESAAILNTDDIINESMLPPVPKELSADILNAALKNPSLSDLGLCSMWPTGRVQRILEILHSDLNLPWWESIAVVALTLRIALLPLNILIKRQGNHLFNHMPQIQEYQKRMQNANLSGNYYEAAKSYQDLTEYLQKNNIRLTKQIYPMFIQSSVFLSMFWALKSMADLPVESLKTGGLWWFSDLTVPDPYYILPGIVAGTLFLVLKVGIDGGFFTVGRNLPAHIILKCIPFIAFPFLIFSSSNIQIYWMMSNLIILVLNLLLKVPFVLKVLKIPAAVKREVPSTSKPSKKGFMLEIKEYLNNYKMHRAIMEREQLSAMNFQKAGSAPTPRTFYKDPTKKKIHTTKQS